MLSQQAKMSLKNSATKVSADEGTSSNWKEMTDKKSGRIFYYNKVTKKTQWTKPGEDSKSESSGGSVTSRKLPTKKMRKRSTVIQSFEDNWQEMKDPKSGKTFYYNTITGVSAWEIPSVSTSKSASQDDKKDKANKAGKDENTQQETEKAVEPGAENIKSEKKKKKRKNQSLRRPQQKNGR